MSQRQDAVAMKIKAFLFPSSIRGTSLLLAATVLVRIGVAAPTLVKRKGTADIEVPARSPRSSKEGKRLLQ